MWWSGEIRLLFRIYLYVTTEWRRKFFHKYLFKSGFSLKNNCKVHIRFILSDNKNEFLQSFSESKNVILLCTEWCNCNIENIIIWNITCWYILSMCVMGSNPQQRFYKIWCTYMCEFIFIGIHPYIFNLIKIKENNERKKNCNGRIKSLKEPWQHHGIPRKSISASWNSQQIHIRIMEFPENPYPHHGIPNKSISASWNS